MANKTINQLDSMNLLDPVD